MFRCKNCNEVVQSKQPINYIVTERRQTFYDKVIKKKENKNTDYDKITGWEIVKQIAVCPQCYKKLTGTSPRVIQPEKVSLQKENKQWNQPQKKVVQQSKKKPIVEIVNSVKIIKE